MKYEVALKKLLICNHLLDGMGPTSQFGTGVEPSNFEGWPPPAAPPTLSFFMDRLMNEDTAISSSASQTI
jgi:hypothetical protein